MATRPGPVPITAAAVAAVLLAAISLVGGSAIRAAIGASSYTDPITTIGDLATGGDAGTTRLAVGADGSVLTSLGGRAQWAAAASGSAEPVDSLPEPSSVSLWLRNADLRGSDGTSIGVWPAEVGPDLVAYAPALTGTTDSVWVGSPPSTTFPIFATTSSIREARWQGNYGGCSPMLPAAGAGAWSVVVIAVGAQLTGVSASVAGWGQAAGEANVTLVSRLNSVTAWAVTTRGNSQTDTTSSIGSGGSEPATTDPTALLLTYDGATLSFWKAVSGDGSWVSVGTLSVTLAVSTTLPFCLARAGGNTAYSSTVGIREAIVWRAALDSTARTALRTYITSAGLL